MNGKDEIIKKRLYFEGLKQAIETPLAGEAMNDVEEVIQDDETEEYIKETLRLWKEVNGPFDNALSLSTTTVSSWRKRKTSSTTMSRSSL